MEVSDSFFLCLLDVHGVVATLKRSLVLADRRTCEDIVVLTSLTHKELWGLEENELCASFGFLEFAGRDMIKLKKQNKTKQNNNNNNTIESCYEH